MTDKTSYPAPPFNPYFALIIGVFAVSTGAIFVRLADAPALVIAAYRLGLPSLILTTSPPPPKSKPPQPFQAAAVYFYTLENLNLELVSNFGFRY